MREGGRVEGVLDRVNVQKPAEQEIGVDVFTTHAGVDEDGDQQSDREHVCDGALTVLAGWLWLRQMSGMDMPEMTIHKWLGTALAVVFAALVLWRWRIHRREDAAPSWGYSIIFKVEGDVLAAAVVALPMLYLPAKSRFASVERDLEEIANLIRSLWSYVRPHLD